MINNKRGLAETLTVVLIILCVVALIAAVYLIVNYFIKEYEDSTRIKIVTTNLELGNGLTILEKDTGKLQMNIKKDENTFNVLIIKAVVLGKRSSGSYTILDAPVGSESRNYVLNISSIGDVREIMIYPLVYSPIKLTSKSNVFTSTGKENLIKILAYPANGKEKVQYLSVTDITFKSNAMIDSKLPVINPEKGEPRVDCISSWECENWSNCQVSYSLNNAIDENMSLTGEQTQLCKDNNKCISYIVNRRECDEKSRIRIKKSETGNNQTLEIFDKNNTLISKLELIKGEHNVLNIEIKVL